MSESQDWAEMGVTRDIHADDAKPAERPPAEWAQRIDIIEAEAPPLQRDSEWATDLLHELFGVCGHCSKRECSERKHWSVLPETINGCASREWIDQLSGLLPPVVTERNALRGGAAALVAKLRECEQALEECSMLLRCRRPGTCYGDARVGDVCPQCKARANAEAALKSSRGGK